jgi:hypothetical protein
MWPTLFALVGMCRCSAVRHLQQLLADDRVTLSSFLHADAFIALYPFLTKVVVPRGAADIAKDRPSTDVILIATKASLVVRKDLHPAIQYLLLNAAAKIHSGPISAPPI